jgi:minor curlin subunit
MKHIFILLIFLFASLSLHSQEASEDGILIKQLNLSEVTSIDPAFTSQSVIMQRGDFNNAAIIQTSFGLNINVAEIYQSGLYNDAFVSQSGSGNITITSQEGIDNAYSLDLKGDDNRVFTEQTGSSNEISQEIAAFGLKYTITQNGSNLSFTQLENAPDSRAYEVMQTGNGMRVILINGAIR